MRIEIEKWTSEGLRCPDGTVDLTKDGVPCPITLIQMPNGTGKTTTLNLLRAALCGDGEKWDANTIRQYKKSNGYKPNGEFLLHMRVDSAPLTIEMRFDFGEGVVVYRTTSPGSGGIKSGWHPPSELARFFYPSFINLFIFDGEFAENLLDSSKASAQHAIDSLFQLYLLDELDQVAQDFWDKQTRSGGASTESGLKQWKKKEQFLSLSVKSVEDKKKIAESKLETTKQKIAELRKKISEHVSSITNVKEKYETAVKEESESRRQLDETTLELMQKVRRPELLHDSFNNALVALKDNLSFLKLPETTSSQFFVDLAKEDNCVCGRPVDDDCRQVILERSKKYLGVEQAGIINAIKSDIENSLQSSDGDQALQPSVDRLNEAVKRHMKAKQKVEMLKKQLIDQGDEDLKKWEAELLKLIAEEKKLADLLTEITRHPRDTDDQNTKCLAALKKKLKEAEDKVAKITGTVELRLQTEIMQTLINDIRDKARLLISSSVLEEVNDKIVESVLVRNPIRLSAIGTSLTLEGQEGASVGQTLALGYTFLTTLLNRSNHQFPLVVDSPANPLSIEVRREVANFLPNLTDQFVGFTISSERKGFTDKLGEVCGDGIKYLTIFRKTDGTNELQKNIPKTDVFETADGMIIEGEDYFDGFDLEDE